LSSRVNRRIQIINISHRHGAGVESDQLLKEAYVIIALSIFILVIVFGILSLTRPQEDGLEKNWEEYYRGHLK